MTIMHNHHYRNSFKADEVLWSNARLIDALIKEVLLVQTRTTVDMIKLNGADEVNRESINKSLKTVKQNAKFFLEDLLDEFEITLNRRLAEINYDATLTGIKYSRNGSLEDLEIDVTVS